MADDKRGGDDDLFEDLDKFFAPIKDVDWDEPASAGARETPSEEHVAVRAAEPEAAAAEATPPSEPGDDEDDWYDTTVIEPIQGLGEDLFADEDEGAGEVAAEGSRSSRSRRRRPRPSPRRPRPICSPARSEGDVNRPTRARRSTSCWPRRPAPRPRRRASPATSTP